MTTLFRMAVALFFQALAYLIRCIMFIILGFIRPIDYLADAFQKIAMWLTVDNQTIQNSFQARDYYDDKSDRE